MADLDKLSDMIDAIIKHKPEEARIAFHSYAGSKMKEEIHGKPEDTSSHNNED